MLHARIVEVLEALAGEQVAEQVERLAHHALRGEVWDKALTYCRQAGEKAMAWSAHRETVEYFEQALSVLPHLPETRHIREQALAIATTGGDVVLQALEQTNATETAGDQALCCLSLREAQMLAGRLGRDRTAARAPSSTFPQAPLRSRTVGFPEYGSDPGFPLKAFRNTKKLKRWLASTPLISRLPSGSSEKTGSSDTRR